MPDLVALPVPHHRFPSDLQRAWDDGDAVFPLDLRLAPPARQAILDAIAPTIVQDDQGERARWVGGRSADEGDALVVATSGTTGASRGVVLTHDAVRASALATSARIGADPRTDRWLACLPLSHVGGLSVITRALVTGTLLTMLPTFDPTSVEQWAHRGATLVSLVPTALRRIDASLFRLIVLGGAAPPEELPSNVVTTYGMTETGSGVVYDGVPLDGVEVAVDQDDGSIMLRGPMLLRCYRDGHDPKHSGGWLDTGDLGAFDADGRLIVHGRRGDLIISGGENVWPDPVEKVLAAVPGVADVAVAGRDDPEWGQRVVAFVVSDVDGPPTLDALRAAVRDALAAYASPRELVLVDAIPRTALGKVRRGALDDSVRRGTLDDSVRRGALDDSVGRSARPERL
jgi:O-succinylbenzoic acid--CoA ligase